jgi:hypothetical protein
LFRKHFNKEDPFTINVPKPLKDVSVKKAIDGVLKKSGVKTSECMRSHAWRKGYKSISEQSGMKSINVELLMGHNIGVSGYYYRPSETDLLSDFMSNTCDPLTISDEHRLKKCNQELETGQAQEIAQIRSRYDTLEARYKQEHEEWGTLKAQVNELRRMFSAIDNEGLKRKAFDNMYQEVGAVVLDQWNTSGSAYQDDGVRSYNSDTYKQWARQQRKQEHLKISSGSSTKQPRFKKKDCSELGSKA